MGRYEDSFARMWRNKASGEIKEKSPEGILKQLFGKPEWEQCVCKGVYSYLYKASSRGWGNISGYGLEPLGTNYDLSYDSKMLIPRENLLKGELPAYYWWANGLSIREDVIGFDFPFFHKIEEYYSND